ncbi:MAG: 4Fe-4S dicluster domain-containing protein [bacterium]
MPKRKIIRIDEATCTGCGDCIPGCPEGALQVIDGKARLVSDLFCDGLGACVGHCPTGAMTVEEREAEPYDEARVMANIVKAGPNTIAAHLKHLAEHGATAYHEAAIAYLKRHGIPVPREPVTECPACACPGAAVQNLAAAAPPRTPGPSNPHNPSCLRNWPVQLMLVPVRAPWLAHADLLIAADCVAAAAPGFHDDWVRDRALIIACPKLDDAEHYLEKLTEMFRQNDIRSVTVLHMTVPCCFGLVQLVRRAIAASGRTVPFAEETIGLDGRPVARENKE